MTDPLRAALRALAAPLPPGSAVTVTVPREALLRLVDGEDPAQEPTPAATWRERLWTCPVDTRLGVREVAEALGRPRSWVYRAVARARGTHRLPAGRLNGELVFEAGVVRAWLQGEEAPA